MLSKVGLPFNDTRDSPHSFICMQMHERAAAVSSCRGAFVCKQPCINSSTNVEAEARRHGSRGNTQRRCQEKPRGSGGGTRGHTSKGLFEGRTLTPHRTSLTKVRTKDLFRISVCNMKSNVIPFSNLRVQKFIFEDPNLLQFIYFES